MSKLIISLPKFETIKSDNFENIDKNHPNDLLKNILKRFPFAKYMPNEPRALKVSLSGIPEKLEGEIIGPLKEEYFRTLRKLSMFKDTQNRIKIRHKIEEAAQNRHEKKLEIDIEEIRSFFFETVLKNKELQTLILRQANEKVKDAREFMKTYLLYLRDKKAREYHERLSEIIKNEIETKNKFLELNIKTREQRSQNIKDNVEAAWANHVFLTLMYIKPDFVKPDFHFKIKKSNNIMNKNKGKIQYNKPKLKLNIKTSSEKISEEKKRYDLKQTNNSEVVKPDKIQSKPYNILKSAPLEEPPLKAKIQQAIDDDWTAKISKIKKKDEIKIIKNIIDDHVFLEKRPLLPQQSINNQSRIPQKDDLQHHVVKNEKDNIFKDKIKIDEMTRVFKKKNLKTKHNINEVLNIIASHSPVIDTSNIYIQNPPPQNPSIPINIDQDAIKPLEGSSFKKAV